MSFLNKSGYRGLCCLTPILLSVQRIELNLAESPRRVFQPQ